MKSLGNHLIMLAFSILVLRAKDLALCIFFSVIAAANLLREAQPKPIRQFRRQKRHVPPMLFLDTSF